MIILNGQSLTPAGQFEPEAMGLNLEERKSTATMQLGPSAPDIAVGAWLLDNTAPGAGIVWRVKSCDTTYNTKTRNYQLEHVINTLKDQIMFGEIKPEDMGGSGGNCTARQAAQYIINQQSIWALGDFEYNVSNPYQFNGDNLYAALETVTASLEDAVWEYDLTQLPFTIHIRQLSSDVTSEMREGRNIQSLKRTVDRSKMFTRFYPIGENNLHISGNYVSRNENVYGTVSKVETDQSKTTQGQLLAWANERISRHCEPSVTVTVQGIDYSQATGEPLDNIRLNKKCRVPLPEYSTTIVETVKKLSWPDKIKEPRRFTVTLANVLEDVASIINRESERSAAGGRGGAAKNEKDHAWFVDTDTHVGMVAEAIAGSIDGHPNWSRVAQLMVDGNGVDARVTRAEGDIVTHTTQISMNDTAIRAEATARQSETSSLSGALTVEAGKVAMVVGTRTTQSGEENYIKAGEIVLSINQSTGASEAKIDAGHVYIGNDKSTTVIAGKLNASDVTANYIQAKISDISILAANALSVAGGINGSGTLTVAGLTTLNGSLKFGSGNSFNKCIVSAVKSADGNTLTLTDSAGDVVNFNKAVALSGAWSGMTYSVSATSGTISGTAPSTTIIHQIESTPNVSNTVYSKIYKGSPSNTNLLDTKTLTMTEKAADKYVELTENGTQKGKVSTQDTYNAGYSAGNTAGYSTGYAAGVVAGTALGYNNGWNACIDAMGLYVESGQTYYYYKYYDSTYLYPGPGLPTGQGQYYKIAAGYGTISKK